MIKTCDSGLRWAYSQASRTVAWVLPTPPFSFQQEKDLRWEFSFHSLLNFSKTSSTESIRDIFLGGAVVFTSSLSIVLRFLDELISAIVMMGKIRMIKRG